MRISAHFFHLLYAVLLLFPFLTWGIQMACQGSAQGARSLYRHFLFINMVFVSFVIGAAMLFSSSHFDQMVGWQHNASYIEFGVVMCALSVSTLFLMYRNTNIMMAPGVTWTIVLFCLGVMRLFQYLTGAYGGVETSLLGHAIYEFLNVIIVCVLLKRIRKTF